MLITAKSHLEQQSDKFRPMTKDFPWSTDRPVAQQVGVFGQRINPLFNEAMLTNGLRLLANK